jgi:hypothetical protein
MAVMLGTPLSVRDLVFHGVRAVTGSLTPRGGAAASLLFIARKRPTMQVIGLVNSRLMSRFCSASSSGATSALAALQWILPNLPQ